MFVGGQHHVWAAHDAIGFVGCTVSLSLSDNVSN